MKKNEITGYQLYNEDTKIRTKQNELPDLYPELPCKRYDIIYADPPWHYNGKLQFDKSSTGKESLDPEKRIFISSASFKYPTVKTKDLMRISICSIAKDDCLLFMWSTNPHLAQAIKLGEAWGFEYKTVAFVWDKMNHNPGNTPYPTVSYVLFLSADGYQNQEERGIYNNWLRVQGENIV